MQIGVIGAGAWGTALSTVAARNGHKVALWDPAHEIAEMVNREHRHPFALKGVQLDPAIIGKRDLEETAGAAMLLVAVPAQSMRTALEGLNQYIKPGTILVICAKGIEIGTGSLMSQIVGQCIPQANTAILSGPTFASEVARGQPTAVTLATNDREVGERIVHAIGGQSFRPYLSNDVIGTQVAGAIKNVLAIACGIAQGRKLGDNARSAVITRGIAEIGRLSLALGGKPETLMSLSGIGDVVLTCTSEQSRNYSLGVNIGAGQTLENAIAGAGSTIEGMATAVSVTKLSSQHNIEMPISCAVNSILQGQTDIEATITGLLARPFRLETGFTPGASDSS